MPRHPRLTGQVLYFFDTLEIPTIVLVLALFPFTEQSATRKRPAIVVSFHETDQKHS